MRRFNISSSIISGNSIIPSSSKTKSSLVAAGMFKLIGLCNMCLTGGDCVRSANCRRDGGFGRGGTGKGSWGTRTQVHGQVCSTVLACRGVCFHKLVTSRCVYNKGKERRVTVVYVSL